MEVHFTNGWKQEYVVPQEAQCRVLRNKILDHFGFKSSSFYVLFVKSHGRLERALSSEETIASLFDERGAQFRITFRQKYFIPNTSTDQAVHKATDHRDPSHRLALYDAVSKVLAGHYRLKCSDAMKLAAMMLYVELGPRSECKLDSLENLLLDMKALLPPYAYCENAMAIAFIRTTILKEYVALGRNFTQLEVEKNYLRTVMMLPEFGGFFVNCMVRAFRDEDENEINLVPGGDKKPRVACITHNGIRLAPIIDNAFWSPYGELMDPPNINTGQFYQYEDVPMFRYYADFKCYAFKAYIGVADPATGERTVQTYTFVLDTLEYLMIDRLVVSYIDYIAKVIMGIDGVERKTQQTTISPTEMAAVAILSLVLY